MKQLMLHDGDEDIDDIKTTQKLLERRARAIYNAYPRKIGPAGARKVIVRILKKGTIGHAELLAAVQRYAKEVEQQLASGVLKAMWFVPHPRRWFNEGRWNDEPDPEARPRRIQPIKGPHDH